MLHDAYSHVAHVRRRLHGVAAPGCGPGPHPLHNIGCTVSARVVTEALVVP
jgi:hypothetical protein